MHASFHINPSDAAVAALRSEDGSNLQNEALKLQLSGDLAGLSVSTFVP